MHTKFFQQCTGLVAVVLVILVGLVLPAKGSEATTAPAGGAVYSWSRLYNSGETWAIGPTSKTASPAGSLTAFSTDMQIFGDMTTPTPLILSGWVSGRGYIIFLAAGLGDPVYVNTSVPTEWSVTVTIPPMSNTLRRLQVWVNMEPDAGYALSLAGPNILVGQPLLPLPAPNP